MVIGTIVDRILLSFIPLNYNCGISRLRVVESLTVELLLDAGMLAGGAYVSADTFELMSVEFADEFQRVSGHQP
jgi:hypothetical protein